MALIGCLVLDHANYVKEKQKRTHFTRNVCCFLNFWNHKKTKMLHHQLFHLKKKKKEKAFASVKNKKDMWESSGESPQKRKRKV